MFIYYVGLNVFVLLFLSSVENGTACGLCFLSCIEAVAGEESKTELRAIMT